MAISVSVFGQTIKGKFLDLEKNQALADVRLEMKDHFSKQEIGWTTTGIDGSFSIETKTIQVLDIRLSSLAHQIDTTFQNIYANNDTSLILGISTHCKYEMSRKNKICPVCSKRDQTIPIIYGDVLLNKIQTKRLDREKMRLGGCVVSPCRPYWYCKRDKKEF